MKKKVSTRLLYNKITEPVISLRTMVDLFIDVIG